MEDCEIGCCKWQGVMFLSVLKLGRGYERLSINGGRGQQCIETALHRRGGFIRHQWTKAASTQVFVAVCGNLGLALPLNF